MSINTLTIEGRLGSDAETRYFQSGKKLVSFSMAVDRRYKAADGSDREETAWVPVKAFAACADAAESLQKGDRVLVIGELRQETWTDKQTNQQRSKLIVAAVTIARILDAPKQPQAAPQGQPYGGYPPRGCVTPEQATRPQQALPYGGYAPAHPVEDADLPLPQVEPDTPF